MAIDLLGSTKSDPPQDRVDEMLRWLHDDIPEYERSPTDPKFLEDRRWADSVIADLRQKYQIPKMADTKEPLDEMLVSIRRTADLYHRHHGKLIGTSATANSNDMQQERDEKFNQLKRQIATWVAALDEIARETQKARDHVYAWCGSPKSRGVPSLYQQIIGSPDYELAEIAVRKFHDRRGTISMGQSSDCYRFTRLLAEAVLQKSLEEMDSAFLTAHREAVRKIKATITQSN